MPAPTGTNPLLSIQFEIPFDRISAGDIEPAIEELLRLSRAGIDGIIADAGPRTFNNTMAALDRVTEGLEYAMGIVRHLEGVATTAELRAAHNKVQP